MKSRFFLSCVCLASAFLHPLNAQDPQASTSKPVGTAAAGFGATTATLKPEEVASQEARERYASRDWVLKWGDEFDQPGRPDPARWNYEVGRVRNGEAQYFTLDRPENARVADGQLIITARKEPYEGAHYTSASLTTLDRYAFTYGKIEIRAQVPAGRGTWAALWTLADYAPNRDGVYKRNGEGSRWPRGGEIDLLEYVGMHPEQLFFTVHTEAYNHTRGTQRGHNIRQTRPWTEFHRYGVVWSPERIEWFFNGERVFTFTKESDDPARWPFDAAQYLILNLAIGGGWGGQQGIDDTIFPSEFRIDYVRIWQRP
ncbi:MAG: Beta-glucanase precursor, partial [Verrucomicrobiota bacterium]|jgi:beta-glucanase (GH16 family)